ncbi:HRDC domain-containing protein [Clostridium chrysemydis]|uniref:HRDC domain-containing protein n=1 Tax=Clostridium chrysemydis TaxID=2665504 RepID=UPI001883A492|nr:HRDC domain-containing protein [Clostridium chrysemydis]
MLKQFLFGSSIKEPIFLKDFKDDNTQLKDLENLIKQVKTSKVNQIKTDYYLLKYGIEGEKNIRYELNNSFLPILVLHDIRLEDGEHSAQMDYIILNPYFIMILETKRLTGDIYINESGDFIRNFKTKSGKIYKKEGIFSPISQNERHVRILSKILKKHNLVNNFPILSCVTIANPKSIVTKTKAPKQIKSGIIKYDQLTNHLSKTIDTYKKKNAFDMPDKKLYSIADFLKENNKPVKIDYNSKYALTKEDFVENVPNNNSLNSSPLNEDLNFKSSNLEIKEPTVKIIIEDFCSPKEIKNKKINIETLRNKLKNYRLQKSKEEKVAAFYIFNNKTLEAILNALPKTKDELLKIQGLGPIKVEKYGQAILDILK